MLLLVVFAGAGRGLLVIIFRASLSQSLSAEGFVGMVSDIESVEMIDGVYNYFQKRIPGNGALSTCWLGHKRVLAPEIFILEDIFEPEDVLGNVLTFLNIVIEF